METPVRILLVEDEPLWQQGVLAILALDARLHVVGVCDRYEEALALFERERPDFLLLDWKIRGERDGLALGQACMDRGMPSERIVLISGSSPSSIPLNPFLFVPKNRLADELLPVLDAIGAI